MLPDIATAAAHARKDAVEHFRSVGATAAESAVTYQPQRHLERRALAYLIGKGVVKLTGDGKHWIDTDAADAWRRAMRAQNALVLGGVTAGLAAFAFSLYRRRSGSEKDTD
jgi:hypothetical protein